MPSFTLTATDFGGPSQWYWQLTNGGGTVKDHLVRLNPADWQYEAWLDLHGYLRRTAPPDRRRQEERRIIRQLGEWIAEQVFGPIGPALVEAARTGPVTVYVTVAKPEDAPEGAGLDEHVMFRPLELACVDGQPLSVQDVSLVFDTRGPGAAGPPQEPPTGPLRMLAVFSLPTRIGALNLRHERHQLRKMIQAITADAGLDLTLRVLQYGVTRDALRGMLEEAPGWDILHFSGHGLESRLILEQEDGSPDEVDTNELIRMLHPGREQLKWVTLSSCLSAAATAEETLRWLGIGPHRAGDAARDDRKQPDDQRPEAAEPADASAEPTGRRMPVLARELAEQLDCAVLAMRFPVGDEFAIDFGRRVYRGVLQGHQSLERAVQLALPGLLGQAERYPPLSVGTPALFGRRGAGLGFRVAERSGPVEVAQGGLAYFPRPDERLVGRVRELSQASRALASQSGHTGVLFHGMAGAGKSACAKELAWQHEDVPRFRYFVWYKAPEADKEIAGALLALAQAMERQVPGLAMVNVVDRREELIAFLPRLADLLRQHSVLIVLDNLESLLVQTPTKTRWRDDRWGDLVDALLSHEGESRVILTSRLVPPIGQSEFARTHPGAVARPPADRLMRLAVHALSLGEAALLARQLPNLRRILEGEKAADGHQREEHCRLVTRMLRLVQGHPKLMDLAEGQAADPETLRGHVERAEAAAAGGGPPLEAFFEEGRSALEEGDFLGVLGDWTRSVSAALSADARDLFHFLCCLEEPDRTEEIVLANRDDYLDRRAGRRSDEPDREARRREAKAALDPLLDRLYAAGLVERRIEGEKEEAQVVYGVHPGVAEAGRGAAGDDVQAAVDAELGAYWRAVYEHGCDTEMEGGGALIRVAGLRAAPYLIRRSRWEEASALLERVLARDRSAATVAALLPLLRRIAEATAGSDLRFSGLLANALLAAGRWQEAEAMMLDVAGQAERQGQFRTATWMLASVVNIMQETGRAEAALGVVQRMKEATRNAGLGPWTQLADDGQRLQLLAALGRYEEVLAEVERLREHMGGLPERSQQQEATESWNVRETVLNTGLTAAVRLGRWDDALKLNAEILDSKRARGASELEQAATRFNEYGPLLRLKRFPEARELLLDCRRVFEQHNDYPRLGWVFHAQADLEDKLGHGDRAIESAQDALRYKYLAADPGDCAISHFNLANYLRRASAGNERTGLAHRLAAMLIFWRTRSGHLQAYLRIPSRELASLDPASPAAPLAAADGGGFDAVCRIVEETEGVRFRELFDRLPKDRAATGPEALAKVLALARGAESGGGAAAP